jgi:hypothetical protein
MSLMRFTASVSLAILFLPAIYAFPPCPGNVASLTLRLVHDSLIIVPVEINHSHPGRNSPTSRLGHAEAPRQSPNTREALGAQKANDAREADSAWCYFSGLEGRCEPPASASPGPRSA